MSNNNFVSTHSVEFDLNRNNVGYNHILVIVPRNPYHYCYYSIRIDFLLESVFVDNRLTMLVLNSNWNCHTVSIGLVFVFVSDLNIGYVVFEDILVSLNKSKQGINNQTFSNEIIDSRKIILRMLNVRHRHDLFF